MTRKKNWLFTSLFLLVCSLLISSVHSTNARFERVCKGKEIQVLTDVDDTLKASGTNFVAGVDTRWPGGSLYAGLGHFYLELSRGPQETTKPLTPGVVSARPEQLAGSFPDVEKEFSEAAKATKGISNNWGKITVILPGEIDDNLHLHSEKRYRDYAATKLKNVKNFAAANPDKCIIFMGDNGQGDQYGGRQMLDELPDQVAAVFIHNVTDAPPIHVDPWENIFIFKTYVDAALISYREGFLADGSVLRVLEGALKSKQYEDCRACYPKDDEEQTTSDKIKCLLSDVSPKFDAEGGGCSELFNAMESVAQEIQYTTLKLPKRILREIVEVAEVGFFSLIFWWIFWKLFSIISIIGLAVLFLAAYYRLRAKKAQKKTE